MAAEPEAGARAVPPTQRGTAGEERGGGNPCGGEGGNAKGLTSPAASEPSLRGLGLNLAWARRDEAPWVFIALLPNCRLGHQDKAFTSRRMFTAVALMVPFLMAKGLWHIHLFLPFPLHLKQACWGSDSHRHPQQRPVSLR